MRNLKFLQLFFVMLLFYGTSCNGQEKDNPAVNTLNQEIRTHFGDTISKIIENPDLIKAYHLDWHFEDDRNANRFHNCKIIDSISRLRKVYIDTLLSIISNPKNFRFDFVKRDRCAFKPDLGFQLIRDNQKTSLLISILVCDEMQFMLASDTSKLFKIDKAHNKFLGLAKDLFPVNYRQFNPVVTTNPINTDSISNPVDTIINVTDTLHTRNQNPSETSKIHKVKKNETISSIAKQHGLKEKDLRKWNKLGRKENPVTGVDLLIEKPKK